MKPSSRRKRAIVQGRRRGWCEEAIRERYGPEEDLSAVYAYLIECVQQNWLIRYVLPATDGH